jgi:hypothetical protein
LIDNVLQSGTKSGYVFSLTGSALVPATTYTSTGDPQVAGTSGQRHFYSDATGVIRANQTNAATSADSPIQ